MKHEDKAWLDWRERFSQIYDQSNYNDSLQSLAMKKSHKLVEEKYNADSFFEKVVEIGAGTGEHLKFVRHKFDQYILTDLDETTLDIAKQKLCQYSRGELLYKKQRAESLSYDDNTFDRLIATHVLEHVYQPHLVIKEWMRVLKSGGVMSILIPTDPGVAWRLGRHLGVRKGMLSQGIEYDYVMAREHVNACNNLIALLRYYCPNGTEGWWPTRIPLLDVNLFFCFHATVIKKHE